MSARIRPRTSAPLLLAVASLAAWALGFPVAAPLVLFCPGWGLLRLVSVLDRNFGVAGAAICGSWLLLGAGATLGAGTGLSPDGMGLAIHGATLALCLWGRLRLRLYDRWLADQPPHPDPMPLWPASTAAGLALVLGVLILVARSAPLDQIAPDGEALRHLAQAQAWLHGAQDPLSADQPLGSQGFPAAVAAGLSAASGVPLVVAVRMVSLSALLACLLLLAESCSRLLGNHGGTRSMLAFLLGLNPLAVVFLALGDESLPLAQRMAPEIGPEVTTALSPFADGLALPMTLAFSAWLLFCTLSILRRASRHVPRVAALASFGLVLSDPRAAALLLPGWFLGVLMSHLACRDSLDNDPNAGRRVRRAREPRVLRAPFWRPALHVGLGVAAALLLIDAPDVAIAPSRVPIWCLVAAVGPGCLFFMPGVRHLNASPGREAFFFVGISVIGALLAATLRFPGDGGQLAARLAALVLAVPAAHGAIKLSETGGAGRRVLLALVALLVALGPAAWLAHESARDRPIRTRGDGLLVDRRRDDELMGALAAIDNVARPDGALIIGDLGQPAERELLAAAARRPLLPTHGAAADDVRDLLAGDGSALVRLAGRPGLGGRELLLLTRGELPQGFERVLGTGPFQLGRARSPDVVLVTITALRADRVAPEFMRQLSRRALQGLSFRTAVTPDPTTGPGLATLLTGLSPSDHDLRDDDSRLGIGAPGLAEGFARRGYRTSAVVSLPDDQGLLAGFEQVHLEPGARADTLVRRATERLAEPDPRPVFLWLHLSDLTPPYSLPPEHQTAVTGSFPFPEDPDPEATTYGVAAFPPAPQPVAGGPEIDTRRGVAMYDALVRQLDQRLAQLFDSVPASDLLVVTAPHGTSLDEHQCWFRSGPDLFEPSLNVPLVVSGGGFAPAAPGDLTSLSDLRALLLQGQMPKRERVLLESGWRPGLGTSAGLDPELDPGARGAARRIWGERTRFAKTLLTRPAAGEREAAGVRYELRDDPDEMRPLPADPFELRRIDAWRRRGHPPRSDG